MIIMMMMMMMMMMTMMMTIIIIIITIIIIIIIIIIIPNSVLHFNFFDFILINWHQLNCWSWNNIIQRQLHLARCLPFERHIVNTLSFVTRQSAVGEHILMNVHRLVVAKKTQELLFCLRVSVLCYYQTDINGPN